MDPIDGFSFHDIAKAYGWPAALAMGIVFLAARSGMWRSIKKAHDHITSRDLRERQRLSIDEETFRTGLLKRIKDLEDSAMAAEQHCEAKLQTLADKHAEDMILLRSDIAAKERTISSLRHLARNTVQHIATLTSAMHAAGISKIPPFMGWDRFIEEGGDLNA